MSAIDLELLRTWPGRLWFPGLLVALTNPSEAAEEQSFTLAGAVLAAVGGMSPRSAFDDLVARGEFAAADHLLASWPDGQERIPADLPRKLTSAREQQATKLEQRVAELARRAEAAGVPFSAPDPGELADRAWSRVASAEEVLRPLQSDFEERLSASLADLDARLTAQEQSLNADVAPFTSNQLRELLRAGELVAVRARLDREPPGAAIPEAALPLPSRTDRWQAEEMLRYHLNPTLRRPPEFDAWKPSGDDARRVLEAFGRLRTQDSAEAAAAFASALSAFLGAADHEVVANRAEGGYLTVLDGVFVDDRLSRLHSSGKLDLYVGSPGTKEVPRGMEAMPPHVAAGPDLATGRYTDRTATAVLSLTDLLRLVVLPADRAVALLRVTAPQWPVDALTGDSAEAFDRILGDDRMTRWSTLRWITHLSLRGDAATAFSMDLCTGMDASLLRLVLRYSQEIGRDLWSAQGGAWRDDPVLCQALRDALLARCGPPAARAAWWAALATCDRATGYVLKEELLDFAVTVSDRDDVRAEVAAGVDVLVGNGVVTELDSGDLLEVPLTEAARVLRPEAEERLATLLDKIDRLPTGPAATEARQPWTPWHRNRFAVTASYTSYVEAESAGAGDERLAELAAAARQELADGLLAELPPGTTNLSVLLTELAAQWRSQYPDVHLDLRCPPESHVAVPAEVVRAAMYEVLDNASEAMSGDADWQVLVLVKVDGPEILIDVRDNGPGLPTEARGRRIFGKEWTTRGPNRGAGLHRARQLVRGFSNSVVEADVEVVETSHPTMTGAALRLVLPRQGQ